jgi:VanZ family protein
MDIIQMNKLVLFIKTNWIFLTLFILAFITFLSLRPLDKLPSVPGSDKVHHLIAYAALMLPTALRKPKKWLLLAFLFIAYSGIIELLQPYVNRYGEWLDMIANITGIICGFILAKFINFLCPVIHDCFN